MAFCRGVLSALKIKREQHHFFLDGKLAHLPHLHVVGVLLQTLKDLSGYDAMEHGQMAVVARASKGRGTSPDGTSAQRARMSLAQ